MGCPKISVSRKQVQLDYTFLYQQFRPADFTHFIFFFFNFILIKQEVEKIHSYSLVNLDQDTAECWVYIFAQWSYDIPNSLFRNDVLDECTRQKFNHFLLFKSLTNFYAGD